MCHFPAICVSFPPCFRSYGRIIWPPPVLIVQITPPYRRRRCPQIVPGLPKTRSGKIMRRILRKIAAGQPDELGDISTLQDPAVVRQIVQLHQQQAAQ